MDDAEAREIARSFCPRAAEVEFYGPYTFDRSLFWEIWYWCGDGYEIAFKWKRPDNSIKTIRDIGPLLVALDEFCRETTPDPAQARSRQTDAGTPTVANFIAIGVMVLVGVIAIGGARLNIASTIQYAAAVVLLVLGAGVALRFFGYKFKIHSFDITKMFGS